MEMTNKKYMMKPDTASAWLACLGRQLARCFPGRQAVEMLSGYADHFALGLERGEDEAALLEAAGTPDRAADDLVRENWPIPSSWRRYLWWGLLAAAAWLYWGILRSYYGAGFGAYNARLAVLPALLLGPLALFSCLHGTAQAEIEGALLRKAPSPLLHILPAAAAVGAAAFFQYWIAYAGWQTWDSGSWWAITIQGHQIVWTFDLIWWVPKLTLAWCVFRSVTASIRYIPCAIHAAGVMLYLVCLENAATGHSLLTAGSRALGQREAALYSLFYLAVLAVTAAYAGYIRRCMKRGALWMHS